MDYDKPHRQIVFETVRDHGPLSSYGVFHTARARGYKMSPSSVRSRVAELRDSGLIKRAGAEATPKRTADTYVAV